MATITRPLMAQGIVSIATRDANGISGGWMDVGDCDMFKLSFTQKFDDIVESRTGNRLISAHATTETTSNVDLSFVNLDVANLTRALNGTTTGKQASGTVTAEAIKAYASTVNSESSSFLLHQNVSTVVLTVASTPLVEGTDYKIDLTYGKITWLAASTVITGSTAVAVSAAYAYSGYAGDVLGLMHTAQAYAIRLDGINIHDKSNISAVLFKVVLNLPKDLSLLDTKSARLALSGMLLQDETITSGSQFFHIQKQV